MEVSCPLAPLGAGFSMRLTKKLDAWAEANLINRDQADAILTFESPRAAVKSWVLYGIVGIGITTIFTGIISLISAYTKLILYLSPKFLMTSST